MVGVVGDGEKMGRHFGPPLSLVFLDDTVGVDWKPSVGIDDDAEKSRVGLKQFKIKT